MQNYEKLYIRHETKISKERLRKTLIEIFNLPRKQSNSGKLLLFVTTALKTFQYR